MAVVSKRALEFTIKLASSLSSVLTNTALLGAVSKKTRVPSAVGSSNVASFASTLVPTLFVSIVIFSTPLSSNAISAAVMAL